MQREYILRGERVVIDELEGVVAIKAGDADRKQLAPARQVGWPDTWVAAAEPVHGWDHPARHLKRKLGKRLVQVTSSRKTELVERFLVEWWP